MVATAATPAIRMPSLHWGRALRIGLPLIPVLLLVLVAIFGPMWVPHDPERIVGPPYRAPGGDYWFGTDSSGMDILSRTIAATRLNVVIATITAVAATVGGMILGLIIGMGESSSGVWGVLFRGIARILDLFEAVPAVVIALVVVAFSGTSVPSLVLVLSIVLMSTQARLVRTEVLAVRNEAFVDAARMTGQSEAGLTIRHVLPHSATPAMENAPVVFGQAVILTASLGFLGVGLPPPTPEWGAMIAQGAADAAVGRWWPATFPSIALILAVAIVAFLIPGLLRGRKSRSQR
ncbi:MAG TPA: ABC transporter permease [Microbacteriaceae bacterium]|nr:ABC transporter permease [Microbacteriaceae bacterium]